MLEKIKEKRAERNNDPVRRRTTSALYFFLFGVLCGIGGIVGIFRCLDGTFSLSGVVFLFVVSAGCFFYGVYNLRKIKEEKRRQAIEDAKALLARSKGGEIK